MDPVEGVTGSVETWTTSVDLATTTVDPWTHSVETSTPFVDAWIVSVSADGTRRDPSAAMPRVVIFTPNGLRTDPRAAAHTHARSRRR
jgi:hypothetical protein